MAEYARDYPMGEVVPGRDVRQSEGRAQWPTYRHLLSESYDPKCVIRLTETHYV